MVDNSIRALIVDDEEPLRGIMRIALGYFGIKVVGEAANGEEAIERYKEVHPNVVLMDINMPKMDGLTALGEIIKINPEAIVLMITATDDETAMDRGRELGARGFLRKPLVMDELHRDILSHLRVQIAKEKGQTLEKDYFKYQIKPGFRPGDEGKHFEPPEMLGATKAIRERQKALESEEHPDPDKPHTAPVAQAQAQAHPTAPASAQAPAAPPPPDAQSPAAPAQPNAQAHAAPPQPTAQAQGQAQPAPTSATPPSPAAQADGVPPKAAVAAPAAPRGANFARVSPEVADILGRESSRQHGELEQSRAEVARLRKALADASDKLRLVADELARAAGK